MVRITATLITLGLATLISAQGTQFITGACTSDADCASACCGFNSGKCAGPVVAQERDGGCGFGDAQPNDRAAVALTGQQPQSSAAGNGAANSNGNAGGNNGAANNGAAQNDNPPAGQGNGNGSGNNGAANNGAENNGAANNGAANNGAANNGAANGGAAANAGNSGTGAQFITGACTSDADCASGCCGFNSGKCAGPVVAQERDGGCGFGDAQPNDNAAKAFQAGQKRGLLFEWE